MWSSDLQMVQNCDPNRVLTDSEWQNYQMEFEGIWLSYILYRMLIKGFKMLADDSRKKMYWVLSELASEVKTRDLLLSVWFLEPLSRPWLSGWPGLPPTMEPVCGKLLGLIVRLSWYQDWHRRVTGFCMMDRGHRGEKCFSFPLSLDDYLAGMHRRGKRVGIHLRFLSNCEPPPAPQLH